MKLMLLCAKTSPGSVQAPPFIRCTVPVEDAFTKIFVVSGFASEASWTGHRFAQSRSVGVVQLGYPLTTMTDEPAYNVVYIWSGESP